MNTTNFSFPCGFPLPLETFAYLQATWNKGIPGMTGTGGYNPFSIGGALVSRVYASAPANYNYSITPGWIFYRGNLLRVPGSGPVTINEKFFMPYCVLKNTGNTLTFNNGGVVTTIPEITVSIGAYDPGAVIDDGSKFLATHLVQFGADFVISNCEPAFNQIVVNTLAAVGGVTGTVYFRKDFTTNMLQISATLNAANAQNFTATPAVTSYLMGVLPLGYQPANNVFFTAIASSGSGNRFKDDAAFAYVDTVQVLIDTAGNINVNWIKPESDLASYSVTFNTVIPLN